MVIRMTDSTIRVGDVCIDLIERGKVQIVGIAAETVTEHRETNDYDISEYKGNALLSVRDDERVFSCVFSPEKPSVSLSGTYDLPASRLARVPVEEANQELTRVQDEWTEQLLVNLFTVAGREEDGIRAGLDHLARASGIPEELVDRARELADVERRAAADGGDSDV